MTIIHTVERLGLGRWADLGCVMTVLCGLSISDIYLILLRMNLQSSFIVFLIGVALQSAGSGAITLLTLHDRTHHRAFVVCLILVSFFAAFLYVLRFPVAFSSDALTEYATAVYQEPSWNPSQPLHANDPYDIFLSVTVFPQVASQVTGAPIFVIFNYFFPVLLSLLPLLFYAVMRRYFGESPTAIIAGMFIPQFLWFQTYMLTFRVMIAVIFLFMLILSFTIPGKKGALITAVLGIGLAFSYIVVAYYSLIMILIIILISARARSKNGEEKLGLRSSFSRFAIVFLVVFGWAIFVGISVFGWELSELLTGAMTILTGGGGFSSFSYYPLSSPAGPVVTTWFDIQFLMIGIGSLLLLYACIKQRAGNSSAWVMAGLFSIVVLLSTVFIPGVGRIFGLERFILYSLPFLATFFAYTLNMIRRYSTIAFLVVLFLLLPMNLKLPANNLYPLYHPVSEIPSARIVTSMNAAPYTMSLVAGGEFVSLHGIFQNSLVAYDALAFGALVIGASTLEDADAQSHLYSPYTTTIFSRSTTTLNPDATLFAFSSIFVDEGTLVYSVYASGSVTASVLKFDPTKVLILNSNIDIVYDDGSFLAATRIANK